MILNEKVDKTLSYSTFFICKSGSLGVFKQTAQIMIFRYLSPMIFFTPGLCSFFQKLCLWGTVDWC